MINPLSASIAVEIKGVLAITNYKLNYTNLETQPVEAIYHFALPRAASLMACHVVVDHRSFTAEVMSRKDAAREYEEAIEEERRTVLVESLNDGLYAINIGNLDSQESIEIELQIAQILQATDLGKVLTYRLPTTIAPRYGTGSNDIEPEYYLFAQYPFHAEIHSEEPIVITHASHNIVAGDKKQTFSGLLDKDIFCSWSANAQEHYHAGTCAGKSYLLGYPSPSSNHTTGACQPDTEFHVLIDRSGSMSGQSIALTKVALNSLLEEIPEAVRINLSSFGCDVETLLPASSELSGDIRKRLRQCIACMNADMGGTEIVKALVASLKTLPESQETKHLIVITDGQVNINREELAAITLLSHKRNVIIHTVGVGYSVNEHLINQLADIAGGNSIAVNPHGELVATVKSFGHSLLGSIPFGSIQWQQSPDWLSVNKRYYPNSPQPVFATGEELAGAQDSSIAMGEKRTEEGKWAKAVVQLAAMRHMMNLGQGEAQQLAEQLGMLTRYTSFIMVDKTGEKINAEHRSMMVIPQSVGCCMESEIASYMPLTHSLNANIDYLDIPAFLRRDTNEGWHAESLLIKELDKLLWRPSKWTANYLLKKGLGTETVEQLKAIAESFEVALHVVALLYIYKLASYHSLSMSIKTQERILKEIGQLDDALEFRVAQLVEGDFAKS
ncbi:VIT domain-containing protein [Alteromonas aestuariivivens]|nr:VIT domain-containing protein [Alteromonas aestuariivivens]